MKKTFMKRVIATSLALSIVLSGEIVSSAASFNEGEKTKNYSYASKTGNISVMADVTDSAYGASYKYKGDIYYPSAIKLNTYVKGYYSSNGAVRSITNEKTVASGKTATTYAYVPSGAKGVCSANYQCLSKGTVKSTSVGTVKYPN